MKRSLLIAASAVLCLLLPANEAAISAPAASTATLNHDAAVSDFSARKRGKTKRRGTIRSFAAHPDCNVRFPCDGVARSERGERIARAIGFGVGQNVYQRRSVAARGVSVAGLVAPLAAKLASIQAACPGTVAVSGVRHTYIAGTRRISLHASGKAVDVHGPYGCIYAELRGWAGGYSTDAGRVRHIHISYDADGGREMGLAFRHGGHRHARKHHRYRRAGHHRHSRHATARRAFPQN